MKKPIIAIMTDFGNGFPYVSTMKAVMKQVDPSLEMMDITHQVDSFDPFVASFELMYTEPYWPKGTILVSVVDPGVGTTRKACCALLNDGNYVITPDNGTLTHLFYNVGIKEIREIDETINRYRNTEEVSVFHGRDIFGYTAARLASGIITFEEVGPKYDVNDVVREEKDYVMVEIDSTNINCFVTNVSDEFGSILFNVLNKDFIKVGYNHGDMVNVVITKDNDVLFNEKVLYHKSFGFVEKGKAILHNSSSGYLSIGLNMANFKDTYHIQTGRDYKVHIYK